MAVRNAIFVSFTSLAILLCVNSCSQIKLTQTIDIRITNINLVTTPENTKTRTRLIVPTPTQLPTQSLSQESLMLQRLLSPQCELPCYLGIIPGTTSILDARSIMDNIGAIYQGINQTDLVEYFYFLHLGEYTNYEYSDSHGYYQGISIFGKEEKAVRLAFSIDTDNNSNINQQYWEKYSIKNILIKYSTPDEILFYIDTINYSPKLYFEILYYYEKLGIEISVDGLGENNQICFDISHIHGLRMTLTDVSTVESIFNPSWMQPSDKEYYSTVNQILGIDKEEFVNRVISYPNVCIKLITAQHAAAADLAKAQRENAELQFQNSC